MYLYEDFRHLSSAAAMLARQAARPRGIALAVNAMTFALSFATWAAMALVMMLPGAAPMLLTSAEIAETAATKGGSAGRSAEICRLDWGN
jgi:predicted metal-binding membrane protein